MNLLFAEISVQKALEALAVSRLVTSHLMDAVVKSVKAHLFALLGKSGLACACAVLSGNACLKVLLGGSGNDFTEHLGIAGSVVSLFESCLAIESAHFGIALADRSSGHSQIHAYLGALARELSAQEFFHLLVEVGSDADLVLGSPCKLYGLINGLEFGLGLLADRTFPISRKIRKLYAFLLFVIDVAADCAFVFHY